MPALVPGQNQRRQSQLRGIESAGKNLQGFQFLLYFLLSSFSLSFLPALLVPLLPSKNITESLCYPTCWGYHVKMNTVPGLRSSEGDRQ